MKAFCSDEWKVIGAKRLMHIDISGGQGLSMEILFASDG